MNAAELYIHFYVPRASASDEHAIHSKNSVNILVQFTVWTINGGVEVPNIICYPHVLWEDHAPLVGLCCYSI